MGFGYGRKMNRHKGAIVHGFWEWKRERERQACLSFGRERKDNGVNIPLKN